jgi:beta-lactamase regulating signal transducer with metallopeptidase domain
LIHLDNLPNPTPVLVHIEHANVFRPAEELKTTIETKPAPVQKPKVRWPDAEALYRWVLFIWLGGSLALGVAQLSRVVRFHKRMREAIPAPEWLADEAEQMGARLGVRVPEILAVPHLTTPLLWCLGRPKLLVPCRLIKSIDADSWRGILAHELAHLCRGDHWVGRLELVAGLMWWWNPLYWLTRRRLDAEAELACDAWVVWALPDDRLTYAEVLFQICSEFSRATSAAPALGVAGSGRFFERRLRMILRDHVPCRVSPLTLLVAGLMALLALPTWTLARPASLIATDRDEKASQVTPAHDAPAPQIGDDKDDADDDDADDDADDDDQKGEARKGKSKDSRESEADELKEKKEKLDLDKELSGLDKKIESALGPDFEKKIEAWAEKFAGEIEAKFGDDSEFVKKMEALGKEMEQKFGEGSEFAKKMEALGKEMEQKFGEHSEFAKKMESLGKDMEKKFGPGSDFEKKIKEKYGPGSDFEKKMKSMAADMEKKFGPGSDIEKKMKEKFGPGSDFEKKMKDLGPKMEKLFGPGSDYEKKVREKVEAEVAKAHEQASKHTKSAAEAAERARARSVRREDRVKALEAKIEALMKELKALKEDEERAEKSE